MGRNGRTPVIVVLALALCLVPAAGVLPTFTAGSMELRLDAFQYHAGDNITVWAEISAFEDPLIDGYLAFQLAEGNKEPEPYSQDSTDNVVYEQVERGINLWSGNLVTRRFVVPIPRWAPPGIYRLDGYLKTTHSPITGVPFIYFTPSSALSPCEPHAYCPYFMVENNGTWRSLRILRNETYFAHETGPVGPRVDPGSDQPFNLTLVNDGPVEIGDISVLIDLYDWDDTEPSSGLEPLVPSAPVDLMVHPVGRLGPGEKRVINGTFHVPDEITAFSILLEARSGAYPLAVYRSRIDVVGEGGRIARITPSRPLVQRGQEVDLNVAFVSPADRLTHLEDAVFAIEISDQFGPLWKDESAVSISAQEGVFIKHIKLAPQRRLINWTVEGVLSLEGRVLSTLAIHLDKEKFPPNVTTVQLTTDLNHRRTQAFTVGDTLSMTVELVDDDGFRGTGRVNVGVYDAAGNETLITEDRLVDERLRIDLEVRENWVGTVTLIANDTARGLSGRLPLAIELPAVPVVTTDTFVAVKDTGGDTDVEVPEPPPAGLDAPWPTVQALTVTPTRLAPRGVELEENAAEEGLDLMDFSGRRRSSLWRFLIFVTFFMALGMGLFMFFSRSEERRAVSSVGQVTKSVGTTKKPKRTERRTIVNVGVGQDEASEEATGFKSSKRGKRSGPLIKVPDEDGMKKSSSKKRR